MMKVVMSKLDRAFLLSALIGIAMSIMPPFVIGASADNQQSNATTALANQGAAQAGSFSQGVFERCPKLKQVIAANQRGKVNISALIEYARETPVNKCIEYAQFALGQYYSQGQGGVQQNYTRGAQWYRRAAQHGNASAQYALGWLYKRGIGVIQDDKSAVRWWKKAAYNGNSSAQFYLAWAYNNGYGVEKNNVKSYAWLSVAVAYGIGTNLDINDEERGQLQKQAITMRDEIGNQLAAEDAQYPRGNKLAQAKALAQQYYRQAMTHTVDAPTPPET